MKTLGIFIDNYKSTTAGLNIVGKTIVTLVLAIIFVTVISAFINVILSI